MRPKDQGTWYETYNHKRNQQQGHNSLKLAEGGMYDAGDVAIELADGGDWLIQECRWRQAMGIHRALEKAERKAAAADLPFIPVGAVLFWKRTVLTEGNVRRSAVGVPEVVVMSPETFFMLIGGDDDG